MRKSKTKILHLREILLEETDDEHGLTMPQLIDRLQQRGISAERKAIYDDFEVLKAYGLDIVTRRGTHTEYAIGNRQFQLPELLLLADAVQSSRFLTKKKSRELINKLENLTSTHQKKRLDKRMHVEGRIKMQNESVYYNIDTIQEAINLRRKIEFYYFEHGLDKKEVLRREGRQYQENPVELIYKDEYYYLITYNDKYDDFVRYRIDRMKRVSVSEEPVSHLDAIKSFDAQEFSSRAFGMFGGEELRAALLIDRSLMGSIIDRFGKEVLVYPLDDSTARVFVDILKSDVFFGWVAQFGNKIMIESPPDLVQEYQMYLKSILSAYEELEKETVS